MLPKHFLRLEHFAGAHEQAELIGRIEPNQENSAIEDKAIPCKADNRMLRGEQETKDRAWRLLPAQLVQTRWWAELVDCLEVWTWLSNLSIRTQWWQKAGKQSPTWIWNKLFFLFVFFAGEVWDKKAEFVDLWVWGRRRKGLFPLEPRWEMKQYCAWLGSRLSEGTDSSGWLRVYENSRGYSRDGWSLSVSLQI